MKKRIVSLHGSYFGNNYGDILLVNIFAKWIHDCCADCVINLPLADRTNTRDLPEGVTGIWNLLRSEFLVFCGGGYFGEQPKNKNAWARRNFFRHGIIGLLAQFFRIPYAIIGVEFGPISCNWFRRVCIGIAKHARVVVVRNAESQEFLVANGVSNVIQSADAVLCLSNMVTPMASDSDDIVIHIPGIRGAFDQYMALINCIVSYIKEKIPLARLLFINDSFSDIYHSEDYRQLFDYVEIQGVSYEILPYQGFRYMIELIAKHRFVITTKLHVGITAVALNKRPLVFWQHPKTQRFHGQIGNMSFCHAIKETELFAEIIEKYFTNEAQFMLPSPIKKLAMINKEEMFRFISSVKS